MEWTPDCQGKWDYDGSVVSVSSRYWPRGGGFHTFSRESGWEGNETRPEIRPSATSSVMVGDEKVASADFEGDTEAEVKRKVEEWVAVQVGKVESAILTMYGKA